MSLSQNILLHSSNKNSDIDLNNDINIRFPNKLFRKAPNNISLVDFNLIADIQTFGNTNNALVLEYLNDDGIKKQELVIFPYSYDIRTDEQMAIVITNTLNAVVLDNYDCVFTCTQINIGNVVDNIEIETDDTTTTYTIKCTNPCSFYFNIKDSIGPLIGMGNGFYENVLVIEGSSTQSIDTYSYISIVNDSGSTGIYPNLNDANCKMNLYDSTGALITNLDDNTDMTISLVRNGVLTQCTNVGQLLILLQTEMNRYSTAFSPSANFNVSYDYILDKVTITNSTGAKFGIGFNFNYDDNHVVSSGSLHKVLGFRQKKYLNITSITSEVKSQAFENSFVDDYVLLCSNIINNNSDINVIGICNGDNIKSNNILFAIRLDQAYSFTPNETSNYKISLTSSSFSLGYKEGKFNDENPNLINFYLRLLSGRHLKMNINWSAQLRIEF